MGQESIISITWLDPGICELKMQDRRSKNAFSAELVQGLITAFDSIRDNPECRVVILTGYDSYFLSGGTQQRLLDLSQGKARFSDSRLYSLPLYCPVPVISAMQGHGIGGGFVLGLFADFVLLARESIYTANFMRYGFTPGMGATCVLPRKLGLALSEEMLLGAQSYRGGELAARGIPFPVLPRAQVLPRARDLAREIAEKPRLSLVNLKAHLVSELREALPHAVQQEVTLQEITFSQPEVQARIRESYGE